jgi:predicted acyltransferase
LTRARDRSLDVFRGATVALMILVNNPGSWDHLYSPLAHAAWHGWTLTDLVFPFFLFAVGYSMALALPALRAAGAVIYGTRVLRRTLAIFAIGLLINASPFLRWDETSQLVLRDFDALRIMGVLQRIAVSFGIAALIIWWGDVRAAVAATVALLLGYWWACIELATNADAYSLEGFFGTSIDRLMLGASHLYQGEGVPFDPEGLASTIPAIAQVLIGYVVGRWLAQRPRVDDLPWVLIASAVTLFLLAQWWSTVLPINKKIWTPSYVLLTSALAFGCVALLRPWLAFSSRSFVASCCEDFGRNALLIFTLSGLLPRFLNLVLLPDGSTPLRYAYREFYAPWFEPQLASLLFAVTQLWLYWLLVRYFNRRGWYWRV